MEQALNPWAAETRLSLHSSSLNLKRVSLEASFRTRVLFWSSTSANNGLPDGIPGVAKEYLSRDEPMCPLTIAQRCRIEPKALVAIRNLGVPPRPNACKFISNIRAQGRFEVSWLRAYRWCIGGADGGALGFSSVGRPTESVNHCVSHVKGIEL